MGEPYTGSSKGGRVAPPCRGGGRKPPPRNRAAPQAKRSGATSLLILAFWDFDANLQEFCEKWKNVRQIYSAHVKKWRERRSKSFSPDSSKVFGDYYMSDSLIHTIKIDNKRHQCSLGRNSGSIALFLTFSAVIAVSVFAIAEESLIILGAYLLFGVIGALLAKRWGTFSVRLFGIVYSVSVLITIALYMFYMGRYGMPYYNGGSDDLAYEIWGRSMAELPLRPLDYFDLKNAVLQPWHNSPGYVYLISLLYRISNSLGGFHTVVPRFLNGMALGLLSVMSWVLGRRVGLSSRISVVSALSIGLLPIMQYTAAHVFRDVIISALTMWVVLIWSNTNSQVETQIWLWVQTLVVVVIISQFRMAQAVAILAIALIANLMFYKNRNSLGWKMYRLLMICALIGTIFVFGQWLHNFADYLQRQTIHYAEYRMDLSEGLSRYVFSAPAPQSYLLRVLYAFIIPLPTPTLLPDKLLLGIGTTIRFFFIPFFVAGFLYSFRNRAMWPLLSVFLVLFAGTAMISFTQRHIVLFLPYEILLAGFGFSKLYKYRWFIWLATLFLGVMLLVAYVFLKS